MIKTIATINGAVHIEMSEEEISQRQAEEAIFLAELPMKKWLEKIADTDAKISRALEDMLDVLSDEQKSALAPKTLEAYNQKKQIRSQKP